MTLARACAPLVLICAAIAAPALAQPVPAKAVRLIVPFAVGGRSDVIARTVGQKLAERWGQPVVIENKPGAATPAMNSAASSPPSTCAGRPPSRPPT